MEKEYKHRRDHGDHFNKSDDNLKQEAYSYDIKGFNLKMTIICSITSKLFEDFIKEGCWESRYKLFIKDIDKLY